MISLGPDVTGNKLALDTNTGDVFSDIHVRNVANTLLFEPNRQETLERFNSLVKKNFMKNLILYFLEFLCMQKTQIILMDMF